LLFSANAAHRANQYLHGQIAPKAQAGSADLEKARAARLEDANSAARPHPHLGHAIDPGGFAGNFGHIRPIAWIQQFQRKQHINGSGRSESGIKAC
jgi:hypothetical protein